MLVALSTLGWLVVRPGLKGAGQATRPEELGGHLAAMVALLAVTLVVTAVNPYSLLFILPSLHAWLWLPHLAPEQLLGRVALYAVGFVGPLLLVISIAVRLGTGVDAIWYLVALVSVGYVTVPLILAALAWAAAAQQMGAIAFGRYAPYPPAEERPERGPIRETIQRGRRLARRREVAAEEEPRLRSVD